MTYLLLTILVDNSINDTDVTMPIARRVCSIIGERSVLLHIFGVQPAELIDVYCTSDNGHLDVFEDLSGTFLCKIGSVDSHLADLDAIVNTAMDASEKQNTPVEIKPLNYVPLQM